MYTFDYKNKFSFYIPNEKSIPSGTMSSQDYKELCQDDNTNALCDFVKK
jgi:hypothetical protein